MPRGTMVGGDSGNKALLILSLSSLELSKPPFHMQMQHYLKRGRLLDFFPCNTLGALMNKDAVQTSTVPSMFHKW